MYLSWGKYYFEQGSSQPSKSYVHSWKNQSITKQIEKKVEEAGHALSYKHSEQKLIVCWLWTLSKVQI